jgi:hypothetical protein
MGTGLILARAIGEFGTGWSNPDAPKFSPVRSMPSLTEVGAPSERKCSLACSLERNEC